jgi:hypothetical protein
MTVVDRQPLGPADLDASGQTMAVRRDQDEMPPAARGHLVIGLGGIGRRTIAELRRTLDLPYGRRKPKNIPTHYLSIDLEDALQLPAAIPSSLIGDDGVPVFVLDMASVREYSTQLFDEVREWLSRYDAAREIGSDSAANPRRLGSLLLAAKATQFQAWLSEHATGLLGGDGEAELQVHVVGYLAGGIGGGALTQLLIQLRRNDLAGRLRVLVYGLLPAPGDYVPDDSDPAVAVNTGAVLTELTGARPRAAVARPDQGDPAEPGIQRLCDEFLVISPPAETGRAARDVRALPEALAMTVRQRMAIGGGVAARHPGGELPGRQPIVAAAPKILTTASDEIEEALSLALLQSALYQIIYANWVYSRGFISEAKSDRYADYVRRPEMQSRWLLTAEHLIQSAPVLDADKADLRWKPLAEDWNAAIDGFAELARGQHRKQWLDCVTQLCNQRAASDFRGVGVVPFYRSRQSVRREMARTIRERVEQHLFEGWERGERGLADLLGILDALIELQRERLVSTDDRVANIRMTEEACRVRVVAVFQKWAGLSSWDWRNAEAKALLHDYSINLQELHVNSTRAEGWLFAKTLVPVIVEELEQLRLRLERLLKLALHGAHSVDLLLDGLSAKLEEREAAQSFVLRLLDQDKLRQFAGEILVNERQQLAHTKAARRIVADHGGDGGFDAIARWIEGSHWLAPLAAFCRDQIVGRQGTWSNAVQDLLGGSIYEAMHRRCDGDFGKLRDLAGMLIQQMAALLPATEEARLPTRLHVFLPRDPAQEMFIKMMKSAFAYSRGTDIRFIDCDDDGGTIHLLKVTAPFSIPDIELLRRIDWQYRAYVQRDRDYAMLSLHVFGGSVDPRDDFALAEPKPVVGLAALLLIGLLLNLVVERGPAQLWLIPKDEYGFDDTPMVIAEDLLTAPHQLVGSVASLLEDNVMRALNAYQGSREDMIDAVVGRVMDIRRRCNDNPLDTTYRSFVEAGKAAAALIRGQRTEAESGHG